MPLWFIFSWIPDRRSAPSGMTEEWTPDRRFALSGMTKDGVLRGLPG